MDQTSSSAGWGTYKYYNIDRVTTQALAVYSRMAGQPRRAIATT